MKGRAMKTNGFLFPASLLALLSLLACTPPRDVSDADGRERAGREGEHGGHADEPPDPRLEEPQVIAAAARVRVLPGALGCTSEVLGIVDVHEPVKSTAEGLELLKRRAALLGAEAVVGVEFEHGEGGSEKTHLSGSAVRCHDLLRGRKYEVLEKIEITAAMDHEDDAFAELKARARAKGANLILDAHFEHGEGDRTKVRGTAVRAYGPESSSR